MFCLRTSVAGAIFPGPSARALGPGDIIPVLFKHKIRQLADFVFGTCLLVSTCYLALGTRLTILA